MGTEVKKKQDVNLQGEAATRVSAYCFPRRCNYSSWDVTTNWSYPE